MKDPSDAIIAVTHRCNAHCVMCNVWKNTQVDALQPVHMRKLPPGLRTVNLTGGEPFLRPDLPEFVSEVRRRCPAAQITISTNAFLPDRIEEMMKQICKIDPSVRLAVSMDGIGPAHDRIRDVEGAFESAMCLIENLKASGFKGLRLSMTVSRHNIEQLPNVASLARRLGLELGVMAAHASRTHLGVEKVDLGPMPAGLDRVFGSVAARWLRSPRPRQWLRAHFLRYTYLYFTGRPPRFRCRAGEDFFFLQADGTMYHCSVRGRELGNIATDDWEHIWRGAAADAAKQFARHCSEGCWMICTARSVYRAKWWKITAWILMSKLLAHLRLFQLPGPKVFTPQEDSSDANPSG